MEDRIKMGLWAIATAGGVFLAGGLIGQPISEFAGFLAYQVPIVKQSVGTLIAGGIGAIVVHAIKERS